MLPQESNIDAYGRYFMLQRALLCSLFLPFSLSYRIPAAAAESYAPAPIPNMTVAPQAGPVALYPESALQPGMKGVAWTVFQGSRPEPVPVEIIGVWQNMWGPHQDIIVAKLGGKATRTNVAGGMSGSPV